MGNKWVQLTVYSSYIAMSTWGLVIGLVFAYIVLLLATRSLAIAAIATSCLVQVAPARTAGRSYLGAHMGAATFTTRPHLLNMVTWIGRWS